MRGLFVRGRIPTGCVAEQKGKWRGLFQSTDDDGKKCRRSVILGKTAEMTKEQAKEKLHELMRRSGDLDEAQRILSTADIIMNADWTTISRSLTNIKQSIGVISQMVVTCDLMSKGFQVFQATSPGSPCDLVVMVHGWKLFRVEVKTGRTEGNGSIFCDLSRNIGKFDVLAVVLKDGSVRYRAASRIADPLYPFKVRERNCTLDVLISDETTEIKEVVNL